MVMDGGAFLDGRRSMLFDLYVICDGTGQPEPASLLRGSIVYRKKCPSSERRPCLPLYFATALLVMYFCLSLLISTQYINYNILARSYYLFVYSTSY